jgi:hypothetical protein
MLVLQMIDAAASTICKMCFEEWSDGDADGAFFLMRGGLLLVKCAG